MAIKTRIAVRVNNFTQEKVASAQIVDLQPMSFTEFCDYMAQDSTVGVADVMAVMTQLEKKLPLLLALGTKVQVSAEGGSPDQDAGPSAFSRNRGIIDEVNDDRADAGGDRKIENV